MAWVTIRVFDGGNEHGPDAARLRHEGIAFRLHHERWGKHGVLFLQVNQSAVARACEALSIAEPEPYSHSPLSGLGHTLHKLATWFGLNKAARLRSKPNGRKVVFVFVVAIAVALLLLL